MSAEGFESSLKNYIESRTAEFQHIPSDRKQQLLELSDIVSSTLQKRDSVQLTFICTHNSRRSHLAQIWAATAAIHYRVSPVHTFSGGTEATAFNPRAIEALRRAGFQIGDPKSSPNPRYMVQVNPDASLECFSKIYNDPPNPESDYCAVMTCSQADQNCPVVSGATTRIAIPYDDPKAFDGSPEESAKYDERCQQIAREMLFVFSNVKR